MRIQQNPFRVNVLAVLFLLISLQFALINGRSVVDRQRPSLAFYSSRLLHDGEQQRVINVGGVTVRELTALVPASSHRPTTNDSSSAADSSSPSPPTGLRLLQVTDGRHLVQAIVYADYKMKDCEYVRDEQQVHGFMDSLKADFEAANRLFNSNNNRKSDESSGEEEEVNGRNVTYDGVINLKLLRHSDDLFPESRRLVDYKWIRNECRILHKKMKKLMRDAKQHGDTAARRKKRELIYPGTNWCGVGSVSDGFNDLGWNAAADRCCRQHDHCQYVIPSFTKKYNLFNHRFHTLSFCECDERFRTCLKMVNNAPSNLIGKMFFNFVQMKCFVLKSEKKCIRKSWWGRCLKYGPQLQAYERDVLTY